MDPVFSYYSITMAPMENHAGSLFDSTASSSTPKKINHYVKTKQTHLYKTEHCRNWLELGQCRYGEKCRYAHGDSELRKTFKHSRYKTQTCRAYHMYGSCPYGGRCIFIHDDNKDTTGTRPKLNSFATQDQQVPTGLRNGQIWHSKLGLRLDHSNDLQVLPDLNPSSSSLADDWSLPLSRLTCNTDGTGFNYWGFSCTDHLAHGSSSHNSFMGSPL